MRRLVWILAPALLLAGCLELILDEMLQEAEGMPQVAYLASDMGLVLAPEPAARGIRSGAFFDAWAQGRDYPTTWRGPAQTEDVVAERLHVVLFVRATAPVLESVRFPDLIVYAGAEDAWMGYGAATTPPLLQPGETYRFEVDVALPHGGLWLAPGTRLGVKVVPVMTQNEHADLEILVGGSTASHLVWMQAPRQVRDGVAASPEGTTGETRGSAYLGTAAPETTYHRSPVPLDRPAALLAWMNTTAAQGVPDLDLFLESPSGEVVAFAGTPTPREALRLTAENLRAEGTYQLVVASYGSAAAEFELTWIVVDRAPR